MNKSNGVYGHVLATYDLHIPAHSGVLTSGSSTIAIPVKQRLAMIHQCVTSVPVLPSVVEISQGAMYLPVEIVNNSDSDIHICKGDQIAQLHQVSIHIPDPDEESESDFIKSFDFSHLSESETSVLKDYLLANRDIFAMDACEMGCTDVITHRIELDDETPFKDKFRPIPPGSFDEVRNHIAELLSAGVIQESKSPFSSNMVLVRKKDGSLRLCVDYRKLNARTKKDAYSIPRVETLIDSLMGSCYFASLDLFAGYHQVTVADDHKERTAFSAGPLGFFEYVKMPFGLCNAPSSFQRMMEQVLDGLTMKTCAVYLDDVIVYAKSHEELYERLSEVFSRFKAANLRLKPSKCKFFQAEVEFLGHVVSKEGTSFLAMRQLQVLFTSYSKVMVK